MDATPWMPAARSAALVCLRVLVDWPLAGLIQKDLLVDSPFSEQEYGEIDDGVYN
jgi:hypothetical protein